MAQKKGSLKKYFLIFFLVEIALVVISGGFSKQLQIGFSDGKFVFRNIKSHYDLQEKITEEFQRDEYIEEKGKEKAIYGSTKLYEFFKRLVVK